MATYERSCVGCGVTFTAKSPTAKWHTPGCKKRVQRNPESAVDAAVESGADQEPTANSMYGRDILDAVREQLTDAKRLNTVDGRIAMYLARKSIDPDCKNPAAMFKEMRAALATALEGAEPSGGPAPTPVPENEIDAAKRKRAEKLAAANKGKA